MGMNTICYLCLDCENTMGLLPNGDPNPDHCVCDTDVRHWQSMNNRDLYWNHNTDGFDCDCDDFKKDFTYNSSDVAETEPVAPEDNQDG